MPAEKYIKIEQLCILKNRLLFQFSCSGTLRKYFLSNELYVEYDTDIHNIGKSISYIPAVSCLITVAGITGADFFVEELDKNFLESLRKIELIVKKCYPNFPFSFKIHVNRIVQNSFSNSGYGLLFSGGLDSTVSYIRHRDKKPDLIMVWGLDVPIDEEEFWVKVKNTYEDFAKRENVHIRFIKTNIRQCINEALLSTKSDRYLKGVSWWERFHSLSLIGLCAPLTVERIGTILFASSVAERFSPLETILFLSKRFAFRVSQLLVNRISWADVKVILDSSQTSRQEKIKYFLKNYIINSGNYPHLWVCWKSRHGFNCNKCEKCSRTITGLILENIDPNKCGFSVNSNFFIFLKQNLSKFVQTNPFIWEDIQRHIPQEVDYNLYGSKEFFEWFRTFDILGSFRRKAVLNTITSFPLFHIYYKLPEGIRNKVKHLKLRVLK